MAIATRGTSSNYLQRAPSPSGLAEVLDVILDKGLVIDVFVRVSVIGIELVTIDARIVIASVDTYLRFAEAVNRLDLSETAVSGLPELQEVAAKEIARNKVEDAIGPLAGSGRTFKKAAKGAAAGAVVAGAAAAAKVLADRRSSDSGDDEGGT
jgi:gas vesicle structural protein